MNTLDLSQVTFTSMRTALAEVERLRESHDKDPALHKALITVKTLQALRFQSAYADELENSDFGPAMQFFLSELYSDKDYSQRDAQFARISTAMERLFPKPVIGTATALAQLHALTEQLDDVLARAFLQIEANSDAERYVLAWRTVGQRAARDKQLSSVLQIGRELDRITRIPGLRILLKLMRTPAKAADLDALQHFFEEGFDIFSQLGRTKRGTPAFLNLIQMRESSWIEELFTGSLANCTVQMQAAQ